ncbi:hypothetical protein PGTUg99_003759 [Puccinia graminis f. sp. tritici]|uniref:Uncharacterized protein n=1 Tax=Puccinia graminis f. sp. tritici TaxID=56615 RepID=A0A5B0S537_PUCGR|nr:hypothetical protein PGTUg99_003759 [Puccinia graminis f. sp. tritici]
MSSRDDQEHLQRNNAPRLRNKAAQPSNININITSKPHTQAHQRTNPSIKSLGAPAHPSEKLTHASPLSQHHHFIIPLIIQTRPTEQPPGLPNPNSTIDSHLPPHQSSHPTPLDQKTKIECTPQKLKDGKNSKRSIHPTLTFHHSLTTSYLLSKRALLLLRIKDADHPIRLDDEEEGAEDYQVRARVEEEEGEDDEEKESDQELYVVTDDGRKKTLSAESHEENKVEQRRVTHKEFRRLKHDHQLLLGDDRWDSESIISSSDSLDSEPNHLSTPSQQRVSRTRSNLEYRRQTSNSLVCSNYVHYYTINLEPTASVPFEVIQKKEKGLGLEDYQEQLDRLLSLSIQTQLGSTRNSQQPQQQHKNTPQHRCRPPPVHPRRSHPLRFQSPAHSPLNSAFRQSIELVPQIIATLHKRNTTSNNRSPLTQLEEIEPIPSRTCSILPILTHSKIRNWFMRQTGLCSVEMGSAESLTDEGRTIFNELDPNAPFHESSNSALSHPSTLISDSHKSNSYLKLNQHGNLSAAADSLLSATQDLHHSPELVDYDALTLDRELSLKIKQTQEHLEASLKALKDLLIKTGSIGSGGNERSLSVNSSFTRPELNDRNHTQPQTQPTHQNRPIGSSQSSVITNASQMKSKPRVKLTQPATTISYLSSSTAAICHQRSPSRPNSNPK